MGRIGRFSLRSYNQARIVAWGTAQQLGTTIERAWMVSDGAAFFAMATGPRVGLYPNDVLAYLTVEGEWGALGTSDALDGSVGEIAAVGASATAFHGLWSQVEGADALSNRSIFSRAH